MSAEIERAVVYLRRALKAGAALTDTFGPSQEQRYVQGGGGGVRGESGLGDAPQLGAGLPDDAGGAVMLSLAPCSLEEANAFVAAHHRHHQPTPVAKFSIMAVSDGAAVGVVIVGLPKARMAMDGWTLEVTRLATNGTRNACSLLYGAAKRAAFALGYSRLLTYTLADEGGASLRASGFSAEATIHGESWMRRSEHGGRFVDDRNPIGDKTRWSAGIKREAQPPRIETSEPSRQEALLFEQEAR